MKLSTHERGDLAELILAAAGEAGVRPHAKPTLQERAAERAAQEAWLNAHAAVSCPRFLARITPEQCRALSSSPECAGCHKPETITAAGAAQEDNMNRGECAGKSPQETVSEPAVDKDSGGAKKLQLGAGQGAEQGQRVRAKDRFAGLQFERVVFESSRAAVPALTVSRVREIGLNVAATKAMQEAGPRVALSVAHDGAALVLGLQPTDETGPGTYSLSPQGPARKGTTRKNVRVACGAVLERMHVAPNQKGVSMTWSPTHRMWCAVVGQEAAA